MKNFISFLLLFVSFCVFSQTKNPDGSYKEFHSNGQLKREGYYKGDKKINVWKEYYDNGQLSKVYVLGNNGKNTGIKRDYSKEGVLLIETKNVLDGGLVCSEYDDEGTLLAIYGLREQNNLGMFVWSGDYKEFYKNGVVKIESVYDNNELNGIWKAFDETGNKIWEVEYLNGYKQGYYKQFYDNKQVKVFGLCELDKKEGEEKQYDSEGKLINTLKYKNDQLKKADNQDALNKVVIPDGVVNKTAVYPGCEDMLGFNANQKCLNESINDFINKNFNHTKFKYLVGIKESIKIKTFVTFRVSETGNINTVRAKSEYPDIDTDIVNLIKKLPMIKPASTRGISHTSTFSFYIVFILQGNAN